MSARRNLRQPKFDNDPLWYKDAAIYQLHIKSFFDSNDDGIGDFPGLIAKLDYIAELGVNTVWLLPFYPSPRLDDGYDISEYLAVHPDYGTLSDVRKFVDAAHARGLRVITELVINHTSDQHPWFQRARRAKPNSNHRNFYVWSDDDKRYADARIIFIDTERSNWTWDPEARAYYWHRFYSHQPDLNFENPHVFRAVLRVMRFWLDLGVDGLRLDAVPYLIEQEGTNCENLAGTHRVLKRLRAALDQQYGDRMLLAEANQWPEDTKDYFGDGDECHMAFHFPLMPRMYMALAREDRFPITDIMRQTPSIPQNCQWAIFLRNHDELTLEMVTDSERDYLWQTYASDRRARLNLGIRRRLAPLLDRDRRRIELMNGLLFSMPGTPVIYYGDELGMGDNIHLGDRHGVRTPMQWSPDRNGGFSRADPAALVLPAIMNPLYGFDSVNVEAQSRDAHSLLNWVRRMLGVRRQHKAFGRGDLKFLYPKNRKVLAYLRQYEDETILCVANISRTPQAVELDLSEMAGRLPIEMTGGSVFPPIGELTYLLTLPPYGFYWFLLATETQWPSWHTPAPEPMPELETLVIRGGLSDALQGESAKRLKAAILPVYLAKRRWYSGKSEAIGGVEFRPLAPLPGSARETFLMEITAAERQGRWFLPVSIAWDDEPHGSLPNQLGLARIRRGRRVGMLTDAFSLPDFAHGVMKALAAETRVSASDGEIRFHGGPLIANAIPSADAEVKWISAEQSNSSLIISDAVVLKIIRSLSRGRHPEPEMTRYLTERAFANTASLLGEVVHVDANNEATTIAIVQRFVRNQGDAWTWMLEQTARAVDEYGASESGAEADDALSASIALSATIGARLGAMHVALASPTDDPAFTPRVGSAEDIATCASRVTSMFDRAVEIIRQSAQSRLDADDRAASKIIAAASAARGRIGQLAEGLRGGLLCRIHGDFHLGQTLVANGDAYIIDFEGEPQRSLEERRAKASPLRDVAGLLRSFDYAAEMVARRGETGVAAVNAQQRDLVLARFRTKAAAAFLSSYREATMSLELGDQPALLDLFLIEKAAYEIAYEAANRPTWLPVPLHGLATLLEHALTPEAVNA